MKLLFVLVPQIAPRPPVPVYPGTVKMFQLVWFARFFVCSFRSVKLAQQICLQWRYDLTIARISAQRCFPINIIGLNSRVCQAH